MKYTLSHRIDYTKGQSGAAALMMVLVLLLVMLLLALPASKLIVTEMDSAASDYRTKEAFEAAEAGLDYAQSHYRDNRPPSGMTTDITADPSTWAGGPTLMMTDQNTATITERSGHTYTPTIKVAGGNGWILLHSSVSYANSNVTAQVTRLIRQLDNTTTPGGTSAPPLVVDGCLTDITGGPVVFPQLDGTGALTLLQNDPLADNPSESGTQPCLDLGHMDMEVCGIEAGVACELDEGGSTAGNPDDYLDGLDLSAKGEPRAWDYLFEVSLADAKAEAAAAGQSGSHLTHGTYYKGDSSYFVYDGGGPVHASFGTADDPVVLIITDTCVKFNGSPILYGFLYYENPSSTCNGFGGAQIIGSVVFEDDAQKLTANTEIYDYSDLTGGGGSDPLFLDDIAVVPGTWADW